MEEESALSFDAFLCFQAVPQVPSRGAQPTAIVVEVKALKAVIQAAQLKVTKVEATGMLG